MQGSALHVMLMKQFRPVTAIKYTTPLLSLPAACRHLLETRARLPSARRHADARECKVQGVGESYTEYTRRADDGESLRML
jgi:hypothetical protein